MQDHPNLAARAGRWSATHRKAAILGWLAFVAVAAVLGGSAGFQYQRNEDLGTGESGRASQVITADDGLATREAVAHGIRTTASVVTSAAIVMVAVFGIFATLRMLEFKEMGVGLALAVLIDATIIRAVLLPATMKLLGDRNWYLPGWLEWLPQVRREAPARGARRRRIRGTAIPR